MSERTDDLCFAIKNKYGNYYCGYNRWDSQLRKATLYHSYKHAVETRDDSRWMEFETFIVRVRITEEDEYNPDLEV